MIGSKYAQVIFCLCVCLQEIVELAGYTARVGNMLKVFEEVQRGRYVRVSVMSDNDNRDSRCPANLVFQNGVPVINGWYTLLVSLSSDKRPPFVKIVYQIY